MTAVSRLIPPYHPPGQPEPQEILDVMQQELRRSLDGLIVPGSPRPYFMLYALRRVHALRLRAAHGALLRSREATHAHIYADVRVGSHKFDNVIDGGLGDRAEDRESSDWVEAPDDLDPKALQIALWKLTQLKFDEALEDYYDHKKATLSEYLRDEVSAMTRERPIVHKEPLHHDDFPRAAWERVLVDLSRRFLEHPEIYDPCISLSAERIHRWLVTSEGTQVITEDVFIQIGIEGWVLTEDGVYVEGSRQVYLRAIEEVPDRATLERALDEVIAELALLREAESPGAYIGPALLSGQAASTLFHEALGHRLEGERLIARGESKTFARKRGERILPAGLNVLDDPTMTHCGDEPLWGSYRVDDEGVPARRTLLVEDGVLRSFLQSRTPVPGGDQSNGHGRHDGIERPMARMGNFVVEGAPGQGESWDALKARLIELARAQGRRHGVIIRRILAGETSTADYDFQVFKGTLAEVHLVDATTGASKRIRDVELIGTPLAALQRIVAFGRDQETDQGFCYAESGSIPVSGIAPPILLSELELQQSSTTGYHDPLLPPPFADDGSRGRKGGLRSRGKRRKAV
ncbi:MAG TPA: TldD/PmbA family protein [Nannocystis sp.]|jgi:predicted Zn-dependent protease